MKLMMVIVNEEYQRLVSDLFQEKGYPATVVASTGDFLQYGDIIFLLGVHEEQAGVIMTSLSNELGDSEIQKGEEKNNGTSHDEIFGKATIFYMDIYQYVKISRGEAANDRSKSEGTKILPSESRERIDEFR